MPHAASGQSMIDRCSRLAFLPRALFGLQLCRARLNASLTSLPRAQPYARSLVSVYTQLSSMLQVPTD